jgi:rod shape-determining protein MreC
MFRRIRLDLQTRFYLLAVLVIISGVIIFLDRSDVLRPAKDVFSTFSSPIERGTFQLGRNLSDLGAFLDNLDKLRNENNQLHAELQTVKEQQARSVDIASQLFDLEKELAFKRNPANQRFTTASADVINRDLSGANQAIQINKGSNDKIVKGMPVLDLSGFLVGRIDKVDPQKSTILLMTDTNMAANVINKRFGADGKQQNIEKGATGTAIGQWQRGGRITIFRIAKDADIKPGDYVFTDGKGATFPPNILVGLVTEVLSSDGEPDKQAVVNPSTDLNRLTRVQVILATNDN